MIRLYSKRNLVASFPLVILLISTACEKGQIKNEDIAPSDFTLSFHVNAVPSSDYFEPITKAARNLADSTSVIRSNRSKQQIEQYNKNVASKSIQIDGIEARMTLSESYSTSTYSNNSSTLDNKAKYSNRKSVSSLLQMSNNRKYRVLIYNTDANGNATTFVTQGQTTAGSTLNLPVNRNKKYRWFAYSFNKENDIPPINIGDPKISVNVSNNGIEEDFLYSTGLIVTSDVYNGQNPIAITFSRHLALIRLEINSRGLFAPISAADIDIETTSSGIKNGSFSLLNGNYSSTSSATTVNNRGWNNIVKDTIPLNWAKYQDFYSVATSTAMRLRIKINEITVISDRILDDAPNTSTQKHRTFQNVTFDFPDFIAKPGRKYQALLQLIESPIKRGSTYWARGNLYYDPSTKKNEYRFRYDNPYFRNINGGINNILATDYWYGGLRPDLPADPTVDPCSEVYPKGLWRLPERAEFTELINSRNPRVIRLNQVGDQGWFISWANAADIGFPTHPHKHLIFTAIGNKNANGKIQNFNYRPGNTTTGVWGAVMGDKGYYRTNSSLDYFIMNYRRSVGNTSLQLVTGTLYEIIAAPIRCVRAAPPNQ
ncbi:hypothetical protein GQF61_11230 [Sphingobacterium sp. DK4209]|uniref:DUF4906 domain-containing protein n=1 Tax=Sphingobacterium zhuxiongii TaxID=2662364 RepID=A0A5Q0QH06_9SPHI|nr:MULTISPECIES: hypothetical protein [unclassified Sphingobacterium]MVZ66431.1 hypothetical protein [Sphingobacterium sp. DK4209]QGA27278.1 hypothetical protein GFH32_13600 [Sphingobacterium sp. dk4302]